ncbi:hypothetical protein Ddye_004294 [Dipteronia dyeriana]|uniref:Uncharacterized protein n=1 Tax=Dipteronia dyeriana TaxID=168575 RepID=A0AAD9XUM4_9ROSI|nr:hypothetical protein Ddye_004294 [Dipteronia dyeriana]
MDQPDPNVCYKNNDKKRGCKRLRFFSSPYTDPMPKKKNKSQDSGEDVNDDYSQFMSFLKNKDETHYMDVFWKRRSQGKLSYSHDIGLVHTVFFAHVDLKWKCVKRLLDDERVL